MTGALLIAGVAKDHQLTTKERANVPRHSR
jgi:hypothetical protein